jgi:hypothetical protein
MSKKILQFPKDKNNEYCLVDINLLFNSIRTSQSNSFSYGFLAGTVFSSTVFLCITYLF